MLKKERAERFKKDVAEMKLSKKAEQTGSYWQTAGLIAMVVGAVGAFICYFISVGKDDSRDIMSLIVLALAFVCVVIAGGASYTAGSLTKALRLWLLRQLYENHQQTEELVAAIRGDDE